MSRQVLRRSTPIVVFAFAVLMMVVGATSGLSLVLLGAVAAGAVGWGVRDAILARRMGDAYQAFAQSHGWEYVSTTHDYGSRFSTFPFGEGVRRRQESVIRGDFGGVRCATFAHVYEERTDSRTDSTVSYAHQVTLAEIPVALPRIDIVPEDAGAAVLKALGGGDVHVESHEFNRRWRVIADDPRYAHAVLDPRMIERLLAHDAEGLSFRIEGGAVMTWQPGRQGTDGLARRLAAVAGIARRIPEHVLREHRELGYGVEQGIPADAPAWAVEPGHLTQRRPTALAAEMGWAPAADAAAVEAEPHPPLAGPAWATESGALTSGRYTGIGVDADGDGIEDWHQRGDR